MTEEEYNEKINTMDKCIEYWMKKAKKLEKKNAELKAENQKWKDEWQEQVQKATDEGYTRTLQTIQLTKAKICLEQLVSEITVGELEVDPNVLQQAEQLISEVEK